MTYLTISQIGEKWYRFLYSYLISTGQAECGDHHCDDERDQVELPCDLLPATAGIVANSQEIRDLDATPGQAWRAKGAGAMPVDPATSVVKMSMR